MKPIIAGVDPGTYVGIAVFDLDMGLVSAATIANGGKEAAVAEIAKHGTPVAVASDVSPPPGFVIQIASYFNARLVYPKRSLLEKEKTEAAAPFKPDSAHERDAIAAAVNFFKENANKRRWVERVLRDRGLSGIEPEVKRLVLSGVRIDDAIRALVPSQKEYEAILAYAATLPDRPKQNGTELQRRDDRDMLARMLEANTNLRSRVSVLEAEKMDLERKLAELSNGDMRRIKQEEEQQKGRYMRKIEKLRLLLNKQRAEFKAKLKNAGENMKARTIERTTGEKKAARAIDAVDLEGILEEYREERETRARRK